MPVPGSVSVIVPAYNSERYIGPCLESLLRSDFPRERMELICVDNGSRDRTEQVIAGFGDAVRLVREDRPGPSAARNAGLRVASNPVVAFTDSDCIVSPGWLRTLVEPLMSGAADVTGGRILAPKQAGRIALFGELVHDHAMAIDYYRPPYLITMNMALRTRLLRGLGGFDERWIRSEDVDISYRLIEAGARIVYAADAVIHHHNRDTIATLAREGFLHGYYRPEFRRVYWNFIQDYRERHANDPPPERPGRPDAEALLPPWQAKLLWKLFNVSKKAGEWAGRWSPPGAARSIPVRKLPDRSGKIEDPVAPAVTVLVPVRSQKREFLLDALGSLMLQTSPEWEALVITDPSSPPSIAQYVAECGDPRIRLLPCPESGFARALNFGMENARAGFVSILLSDDRYAPNAIETLTAAIERSPGVDFFHSARRHIDAHGGQDGGVMPSRKSFLPADFENGSPVKHLLCWRRSFAQRIGGMDESLSLHGCDDYDFPWRMSEAGARFEAIEECLYEYRLHHEDDRLTTSVPLERQIATLRTMFTRHGVPAATTDRFVQRAIGGYFVSEYTGQVTRHRGALAWIRCFRDADEGKRADFIARGWKHRHFFPHRVFVVPKGGPDGFKLARRMTGATDPGRMLEFLLYALPPLDTAFPERLYFDDDIQWHQQQFGLTGQVACANVIREPGALRCYVLVSDLVQRIGRAQEFRSPVDTRFKGWSRVLLHAILSHANENGIATAYSAGSALVLRNTDPKRSPQAPLYERIYDETARELGGVPQGEWWRFDIPALRDRLVALDRGVAADVLPKTVCILHDTERGQGHRQCGHELAARADREAPGALERMLAIEAARGVRTTYSVTGTLFPEVQAAVRAGSHALAFHSYDHRMPGDPGSAPKADGSEQLAMCRSVDYRIKGYRPPQSKILPGLSDANLTDFNFEWLASSRHSLGSEDPRMENGLVKIPVHADDFPLYDVREAYEVWEKRVFEIIERRDFAVIGLHDCYAHLWLDRYESFLDRVMQRATLLTLDQVAARLTLGNSRWFLEP